MSNFFKYLFWYFFRNPDVLKSIIVELIRLKWTKIMISTQKLDKRIESQMIYDEF